MPEELSVDGLIQFAVGIRSEQDALPRGDRIYIGGDLVLTQLNSEGITTRVIYRFPDQYDAWQAMHGLPPTGIVAALGEPYPR